ncbi:MAG: hypothetical protein L0Y43_11995 [Methylococcaceae bacterium]|nr:hypothetical protein [Methylococcaceae bacterium]
MNLFENLSAKRQLKKGIALTKKAMESQGAAADSLFAQAIANFTAASGNEKAKGQALYRWGLALYEQSQRASSDGKVEELLQQSCEKYAAAAEYKDQKAEALNDWGVALIAQAKMADAEAAATLFEQAKEKLLAAEQAFSGTAAYNLACISSLMNAPEDCQQYLQAAKQAGKLPPAADIRQDQDLDNVRGLDWFEQTLKDVK